MTAGAESQTLNAEVPTAQGTSAVSALARFLAWTGDRLNPILVKEARQALKSRQFVVTFGLLLVCGWVWTIMGLAVMGPEAALGSRGPDMFAGYYVILSFPLLVIVPFGAFRSIASEQEDRTYELLSITGLAPRQIVSGKLGSAIVQMLIYLSAISPCLAFTYMLRGISLPMIFAVVSFTVLASLAFSLIALLLGTISNEKHWQVVLSVILVVALFLAFWGFCAMYFEEVWFVLPYGDPELWQAAAGFMTGYVTYFLLVFYAAVARVTFASDNRSSKLRFLMVLQYACFTGWMFWIMIAVEQDPGILMGFMAFVGVHWYVMGAMMTGESTSLSPRVRRQLPTSFLGRVFFTWFNPGPGTGYMFAISSSLGALLLVIVAVVFADAFPWRNPGRLSGGMLEVIAASGLIGTAYLTIYLGLGLLVVRFFQRFSQVGIAGGMLIQALLVFVGTTAPLVIQLMSATARNSGYTLLQISNPFWTIAHVGDSSTLPLQTPEILVLLIFGALVVFAVNLPGVVRELRYVRVAKPARVAEEDAETAARLAPPEATKTSPWDD